MKKKTLYPISALDICLSNRCNLACRYCYFDTLNQGPARFLSPAQLHRALVLYADLVPAAGIDKISLAGGEPLLDYQLAKAAVEAIRERF
ncbi:MAG: radical SAM protein, partial [Elusimicrobia bacterium]|nr:radical SAM protein [Elusimicrobiota bacterium]